MTIAATRRLPGIRFEAESPPPLAVLPRMDMAAFVGFAASGPIDVPVAVEDAAQFEAVFGRDAPLFRDERTGDEVRAHLAPAVRAFFRNGGRRCFVVRVAGPGAVASSFPVPGLAARGADGSLFTPLLRARSEGRWCDDLRVGAALLESPLPTASLDTGAWRLELASLPAAVARGDLVRVSLRTPGYVAFAVVASVEGRNVHCDPSTALWLARRFPPDGAAGTASFLDDRGVQQTGDVRVTRDPASPTGERVKVQLTTRDADAPADGSTLHTNVGGRELHIVVDAGSVTRVRTSRGSVLQFFGRAFWPVAPPDRSFGLDASSSVDVCTFELWAGSSRLGGLGFAAAHERYAGGLPTDAELYAGRATAPLLATPPPLWAAAGNPRFPLASPAEAPGVLYPLGMGALPEPRLGARQHTATALDRDGLASFDASLFLDARVADAGPEALVEQAEFIELGDADRLRGLHAVLAVDEATIVAAPDAAQRPWVFVPAAAAHRPRRRHPHRRRPFFEPCGRLHPPQLRATTPDESGTFALEWTGHDPPAAYVLQEARDPEFGDVTELYRGVQTRLDVHGRERGAWYYRVRIERPREVGPFSTPVTVEIVPEPGWRTVDDAAFDASTLVNVQRALLRAAAARGDLFALLALPGHYREDLALAHAATLRSALADGEERALGYGALHHPWPTTTEADDPTRFRNVPPEGTIAGVMARRTLDRGAWIAPANDPLRDVIALDPPIDPASWQRLQDAQLNILRRAPQGFLVLSADTLSTDVDVRPINVRRLLALLRRAALLHGTRYVFEPNDDALRRRVQRGFENLLGLMYRLGAFSGATASEAFRVEVGDPPNTRPSVDAGRLIVELKVAPSLPLRFLTVRLVERGERGLQVEAA